jgi:hypothetical protein
VSVSKLADRARAIQLDSRTPEPESKDPTIELLQTLHAASLTRWANRRDYEWKLNYAVWVAMAGLIALLVTKHVGIERTDFRAIGWLAVTSIAVVLIQLLYLIPITSRGICEIEMQTDLEKAMHKELSPDAQQMVKTANLGAGMERRGALDKHYGVYAPLVVTAILAIIASFLLLHPISDATTPKTTGNQNHPCAKP